MASWYTMCMTVPVLDDDRVTDLQPVGPAEAAGGLSEADQAAITADEAELAELKEMWQARELSTREYRQMRRTVEERVKKLQRKTVVRPAAEVLDGMSARVPARRGTGCRRRGTTRG
jgi:hypothetical protein